MIGALVYLQTRSLFNRLHRRVTRLKQPKYLFGAIVGGCYFYFYFFRFVFQGGGSRPGAPPPGLPLSIPDLLPTLEFAGALILLLLAGFAWLLPKERSALSFSEAEVAFLFPAPVSRRTLIHWKLIRSQLGILSSTVILTLVSNRFGGAGSSWIRAAGWWIILSTLNLHFLGSSFAITRLMDRGLTTWKRRALILAGLAALVLVVKFWAQRTMSLPDSRDLESIRALVDYLKRLLESGPALYLLFPFRLVIRPFLAPDAMVFVGTLGPALLLMTLHYVWVVRANVSFEEASIDLSRKTAERISAMRAGNYRPGQAAKKPQRSPFALRPDGPAWVGLFWKNLISIAQGFSWRLWLGLAGVVLIGVLITKGLGGGYAEAGSFVGVMSMVFLAWTVMIGPQILRQDLRADLPNADLLKLYPLRGWQVVLGEILAPVMVLACLQWSLVAIAGVSAADLLKNIPGFAQPSVAARLAACFGVTVLAPAVTLFAALVPNAAVLLFPAWFQTGKDAPQGIEATGQRIIFAVAQMLVLLLALTPAALAAAVAFAAGNWIVGPAASILGAALAAAVVILAEAAAGLAWLGRVFERFDLSVD